MGIAKYYGIDVSRDQMIQLCGSHKKQGSPYEIYTKGIEEVGLKFFRVKFNYRNVKRLLKNGFPVVLTYICEKPYISHFSTIVGCYKKSGRHYYCLNDTMFGEMEIPATVLEFLCSINRSWVRGVKKIENIP